MMPEKDRQAPHSGDSGGEFELFYRWGSFSMRESFTQLRVAIARLRELDKTSTAHSFAITQDDHTLLRGEDVLHRVCHPAEK